MREGPRREHNEASTRDEFADLREGEVLCDRHRQECYQVIGVDDTGVALRQEGTEFYIPRSLFVTCYRRRLFSIENATSIDTPDWCCQHQDRWSQSNSDTESEPETDQLEIPGRTAD